MIKVVVLFSFVIISLHPTHVEGVQITAIKVPNSVDNGDGNATVILDCEYSLLEHEKQGLVVQWWFVNDANGNKEIIYQWIPGVRPQVSGIFRDRVNLEFRISDDIYHRHRAIQVMKLSNNLSGDYLCKVSTFDNEDTAHAKMVVYVPPRSFTIETKMLMSAVNISCEVKGVHPTPDVQLIQEESSSGKRIILQTTASKLSSHDGLFDSTVYRVMEDISVPVQYECQLSIPGTEYLVSQKILYDPGLEVTSTFSPPNNGIDNEADYEPMDSGSSFMPSYPPHQSQDSSIPRQMLTDEEIKENSLLSAGRGIRAPESSEDIADNGANLNGFSSDRIFNYILVAVLIQSFFY